DTSFRGLEEGSHLAAGRIVRVEVDRETSLLLDLANEKTGRVWLTQPGHILDGNQVRAELCQFLGKVYVVLKVVLGSAGVKDVAGVANGRLAQHSGFKDRIHRHAKIGQPVQGVEDAKQIDPGLRRFLDKCLDDVVRVIGVAHRISGAEEHLKED